MKQRTYYVSYVTGQDQQGDLLYGFTCYADNAEQAITKLRIISPDQDLAILEVTYADSTREMLKR